MTHFVTVEICYVHFQGVRDDIDGMDDEESYYKWLEENPNAGRTLDDDGIEIEYGADGNPIAPEKSKWIDPLPPINHAEIEYKPFERNLYKEHSDISTLSIIQASVFLFSVTQGRLERLIKK